MNNTIAKAMKALSTAMAYAGDGAILTAISCTQGALILLEKERQRRIKMGLYPKEKA